MDSAQNQQNTLPSQSLCSHWERVHEQMHNISGKSHMSEVNNKSLDGDTSLSDISLKMEEPAQFPHRLVVWFERKKTQNGFEIGGGESEQLENELVLFWYGCTLGNAMQGDVNLAKPVRRQVGDARQAVGAKGAREDRKKRPQDWALGRSNVRGVAEGKPGNWKQQRAEGGVPEGANGCPHHSRLLDGGLDAVGERVGEDGNADSDSNALLLQTHCIYLGVCLCIWTKLSYNT